MLNLVKIVLSVTLYYAEFGFEIEVCRHVQHFLVSLQKLCKFYLEKKINIYTIFKSCVFQQQPPRFGYHSGWHESKMVTARKHLRAGFMKEKEKNKECSNKSCRRGKRDYRWESSSCSSRNGRYNNNSSTGQLFTPTRVTSKTVILLWNIMAGLCCSHVVHVTFFSIALK